jgi:outer membrane protein TolC
VNAATGACAAVLLLMPAAGAPAQTLSLDDAVSRALIANPGLRAAAAGEAEARERHAAATGARWPRVTVDEGWQRGNNPVFAFGSLLAQRRFSEADFAVTALNRPDPISNFRAAVSVSQPLFDAGATAAAARAGATAAAIASVARRAAAADLIVAIANAYGQALTADATGRSASAAIDASVEDAARARARHDEGVVTDADVLSIDVHLAQMQARQIAAAAEAQIARATLNRLIGAPLDSPWELVEPAPEPAPPADAAVAAAAVPMRPDVLTAMRRVELAQAQESSARATFWPTVTLDGGYEWNGGRWATRASSWVLGVRGTWVLSTGGSEHATAAAAAHAVDGARAEQASTEAAAHADVHAASTRLAAARARLQVGAAAVAQARES